MGSTAARQNIAYNRLSVQWTDLFYGDEYTVVRSKTQPDLQAQEYVYELDPKRDANKQLQIYKVRNNLQGPIVKSLFSVKETVNKYFSMQNIFTVITQRIPYRLSSIPQFQQAQAIYVARQALRGYQELYSKVGFFKIEENMIGFTNEGQVKVWFNKNLALNYPEMAETLFSTRTKQNLFQQQIETSITQQQFMVKNIIKLIQNACKNGQFSQPIHSNLQKQNIGFSQADTELEKYTKQIKIFIPCRINLQKITRLRKDKTISSKDKPLFYKGIPSYLQNNYLQKKNPYNATIYGLISQNNTKASHLSNKNQSKIANSGIRFTYLQSKMNPNPSIISQY